MRRVAPVNGMHNDKSERFNRTVCIAAVIGDDMAPLLRLERNKYFP